MNAADTAALPSTMEGGRLVRAKKGRGLNLTQQVRVIAPTNRLQVLSPQLKLRFAGRALKLCSQQDFVSVVKGVLVRKEVHRFRVGQGNSQEAGRFNPGCTGCREIYQVVLPVRSRQDNRIGS